MIRTKKELMLAFIILMIPIAFAVSNVQHSVSGNTVIITYDGTPPFNIDIRGSSDFSKEGASYVRAKTNSDSYSKDMSFAYNPSGTFYYKVKDAAGWSEIGGFSLGESVV